MFTLTATDLRRIVTVCHPCRDDDSQRFTLGGVLFDFHAEGNKLTCVGTDGRRMAIVDDTAFDGDRPVRDVIVNLTKLFAKRKSLNSGCSKVEVTVTPKNVEFVWTNKKKSFTVTCPIIDGRFPTWRPIVPKASESTGLAEIVPAKWIEAWDKFNPFTGFHVKAGDGDVKMEAAQEADKLSLPVKMLEGEIATCWNLEDFVIPFLESVSGEKGPVELRCFGRSKPATFTIGHITYILMPMADKS